MKIVKVAGPTRFEEATLRGRTSLPTDPGVAADLRRAVGNSAFWFLKTTDRSKDRTNCGKHKEIRTLRDRMLSFTITIKGKQLELDSNRDEMHRGPGMHYFKHDWMTTGRLAASGAFPGEVDTGSPSGNATKQGFGALQCFRETLKISGASGEKVEPDYSHKPMRPKKIASGGSRNPVAAVVLGFIERDIGPAQQRFGVHVGVLDRRNAGADRNVQRATGVDFE